MSKFLAFLVFFTDFQDFWNLSSQLQWISLLIHYHTQDHSNQWSNARENQVVNILVLEELLEETNFDGKRCWIPGKEDIFFLRVLKILTILEALKV